jgi:G3E family GTPase
MAKPRLIIASGFLGSGKTTLIMNLGRRLSLDMKKRVAVITNDQGEVLVLTSHRIL